MKIKCCKCERVLIISGNSISAANINGTAK